MVLSSKSGQWEFNLMTEWPAEIALNAWGVNPDGQPDRTQVFGDVDGDSVLDRIPPQSLLTNFINITDPPPYPHLAFKISLDDGNLKIYTKAVGSQRAQLALFILLGVLPVMAAITAVWIYLLAFYRVQFNKFGIRKGRSKLPLRALERVLRLCGFSCNPKQILRLFLDKILRGQPTALAAQQALNADAGDTRRTVLIATMEYDIDDWKIAIKIGGLGVMAQLMSTSLGHQNLIWVVPCVGGINYPLDQRADPIEITMFGKITHVEVQYHVVRNITYVLLDAPVFRAQTKSSPYPERMDDLGSALYYSAWNNCIAETLRRFPVDLYHINDYHGAVAPLYLLPNTIPCCLTLHNAEFQGLWPMRTEQECNEICTVFNLDLAVVKKYIQFGEVFNLLHAAATYLHIHQNGFGAVGVSEEYGKRSYVRYPIFWGLKQIGSLSNPDPTDTGHWRRDEPAEEAFVDPEFEARRASLTQQAQEWAGLDPNPNAELFVFVGRWSMQKGIDLIADVFPSVLENYPNVQLICVGPVIDLYGRFAAIKFNRMMDLFPGRVLSRPEFTFLPPYIFSGAEFALIPSRDEPFGLVAVEFGRKGALGIGSR